MPTIKLKKAMADHLAKKEKGTKEKEKEKEKPPKPKKERKSSDKSNELRGLDGEVLFEKRKRVLPPAEQTLHDWVDFHIESKSGVRLNITKLYEFYGSSCLEDNKPVVEITSFSRVLKDKFGKEFGFKDISPLKGLLKETKLYTRKTPSKPKTDTEKRKLVELIQEVLIDMGNPNSGIYFGRLASKLVEKYPSLTIASKTKVLNNHLDNLVWQKQVSLVRGAGRCGYYRVPGLPDTTTDDDEKENEVIENGVEGEEKSSKKSKKKKDGDGKGKDGTEDGDEKGTEGDAEGEGQESEKKKKKKKRRPISYKPIAINDMNHANPTHIEDTFPLAMTYCSEPKASSFTKMKKYITHFYPDVDEDLIKPALDKGLKLGIWELISGNYTLNIEEFDPNLKDSIDDVICAAIIATTEPKIASARSIKQYVQDYHPEFNIDNNLHKFRQALQKACNHKLLQQVTGLGMAGSYQLMSHFTPSPALLAGYEGDDNDSYVVRPTKSGRGKRRKSVQHVEENHPVHVRAPPKDRSDLPVKKEKKPTVVVKKAPKGTAQSKKRGRKLKSKNDEEEEQTNDVDNDVEVEPPVKKQNLKRKPVMKSPVKMITPKKIPAKKGPLKSKGRQSKASKPDEDNAEEAEAIVEKRSPTKRSRSKLTPIKKTPSVPEKSTRSSRGKSLSSYKDDEESETDKSDDDEPAAKKSRSRR